MREALATPRAEGRRTRKSAAGRRASAANALTHGLTSRSLYGRDLGMVELLAEAFIGEGPRTPRSFEAASLAAAAHIDVLRSDAALLYLLRAAEEDASTFRDETAGDPKAERALLKRALMRKPVAGDALQDLIYRAYPGPPRNTMRRHLILHCRMAEKLEALSRYAASARARRRRAVEELDRILGGFDMVA